MTISENGFYFISDQYFIDFPDRYLKANKAEKRPFYFCLFDSKTELLWMIPLSSKEEKIKLAEQKIKQGKSDIFHLTTLGGKPGVMIIHDIFPVTSCYIKSEYAISGIPVQYKDTTEIRTIRQKAMKVLSLLRRGVKLVPTAPDIFTIEKHLLNGTTLISENTPHISEVSLNI